MDRIPMPIERGEVAKWRP